MSVGVSQAVTVVEQWSQRDVMIVIAKIVCADWTRFVVGQCGTQPVRQKPSSLAGTVVIVPMAWATAQEIAAVLMERSGAPRAPASCVFAIMTRFAVRMFGITIAPHGPPRSA